MNAHTTQDGELMPTGPSTPVLVHPETSPSKVPLPLAEGMDVNDDIDPYRTPPMAELRSVSQVPVLPTEINQVPLVIPGRANMNANLLLAATVKAGGKAQAAMSSDPAITHAIALIRGLLDDASGGIVAVTDTVIASGDMEIDEQTTAVRAEFHTSLYLILRGLDKLTESIQDMCKPHELDLQLIREEMAKMRGEMKTDSPKSTPVSPKSISGPKNTPKPPPPAPVPPVSTTALPKQNPKAPVGPKPKPQPITFQVIGSGTPVPSRSGPNETIADWDMIMSRIDDEPLPQCTWAELVADKDTPTTGPANSGPVDTVSFGIDGPDPDDDDRFTRVEKGKGRVRGERPIHSFAQAAKQAPTHPIPNAAKIT
ncbi:hypothetical protein FRC06_005796 [Ceratobasidium sp. 370]|nr:hypothetical protein FRC06_005796 [Ceratobasidium sp. 370]